MMVEAAVAIGGADLVAKWNVSSFSNEALVLKMIGAIELAEEFSVRTPT